jgi:hypothetical protein
VFFVFALIFVEVHSYFPPCEHVTKVTRQDKIGWSITINSEAIQPTIFLNSKWQKNLHQKLILIIYDNRSFNFSFPDKTVPLVLALDPSLKFKFGWQTSCIAAALEHKYTHYECPSFSSSRSISLLHLHHFCPLVFLMVRAGPQSPYIQSDAWNMFFFLILVFLVWN